MNGTVLHIDHEGGIILGEDGTRYPFWQDGVENPPLASGSRVNFMVEQNRACGICRIAWDSAEDPIARGENGSCGRSEVKTAATIAGLGAFVSLITSASFFFAFAGFAIELVGIYRLARYKNRMELFWYQLKAAAALSAAALLGGFALLGSLIAFVGGPESPGTRSMVMGLLAAGAAVYSVYAMFRSLDGMADAYDSPLFTVAAWLYLAGVATLVFGVGFVILLAYTVVLIIAYFTIKEM